MISTFDSHLTPSIFYVKKESFSFLKQVASSDLVQKTKTAATHALSQLALSLFFISLTSFFVISPAITSSSVILAVISSATTFFIHFAFSSNKKSQELEILKNTLSGIIFASTVDSRTRDVLFHEFGHSLAARLLFKEANPHIAVTDTGGYCSFRLNPQKITPLGSFVGGALNSKILVTAAGPLICVATACAFIALAHFLPEKFKALKAYLEIASIHSIFVHFVYALSGCAASPKNLSHDFVALHVLAGIHPITSAIAIVAIPAILKIALYTSTKTIQEEEALGQLLVC